MMDFHILNQLALAIFALAVWALLLGLYRLFLHPLRKYPGPKLAALTGWYEVYYEVWKPSVFPFKLKELHAEYGPVVRITPWEISVQDNAFIDELFAFHPHRRDKHSPNGDALGISASAGGSVTHELHRKRREALNPFFSPRSISQLEDRIISRVDVLDEQFAKALQSRGILNLSDAWFGLCQDVVTQYCFAFSEGLVEDLDKAKSRRENLHSLLASVKVMKHFGWIIKSLPRSVPPPPGVLDQIKLRARIGNSLTTVLNDVNNQNKGSERSIFYDLRDDPDLPPSEKEHARLLEEGTLLIMAGTESPARSLMIACFHLLDNRNLLDKLRTELRPLQRPFSLAALEHLPYLNAIISEANRLSFGLASRFRRSCPNETLRIGGYAIPPNTIISMSTLGIHTDANIYPDPWSFVPDRWLGEEGSHRQRYNFAFGKGSRHCVGQGLAKAEMRMALAMFAGWDMELFETDLGDVEFRHDNHVAMGKKGSKGLRARILGKSRNM